MAMLQKRLYETSQQPRHAPTIMVTEGFHAQNHLRHAPPSPETSAGRSGQLPERIRHARSSSVNRTSARMSPAAADVDNCLSVVTSLQGISRHASAENLRDRGYPSLTISGMPPLTGSQAAVNRPTYAANSAVQSSQGLDDAIGPLAMLNRKLCDSDDMT